MSQELNEVCERRASLPVSEESDESLRAHAILVARGGRPMSIAGSCRASAQDRITELAISMDRNALPGCVAFIVDRLDGHVDYGYAVAGWVVDLYRWAVRSGTVPALQRQRILGMLLGFGAGAISEFDSLWESAAAWSRIEPLAL